jgi:2-hydroxychromene-2-carboxylate isomerase
VGVRALRVGDEMTTPVRVTMYNDAGCPWGYSANPAFRVLEWRYGEQLDWRLVLIGLTNVAQEYVDRGYTPLRSAEGYARRFRRFGMPLAPNPRERIVGTGRSCRAVVAVRLQAPGREWAAFRALQFGFFTSTVLLDEDEGIAAALAGVEGIDVPAVIAAIDSPAVEEAYQRDRAEARSAAGSPTQLQDKHATSDGPVRYTAPSLVFEHAGRRLEAGGWQTVEAYDVIVANLIPDGERRDVPEDAGELLSAFPEGLTTQEMAQLLTRGNDAPDRTEAEVAMLRLVAAGAATRAPLGDDALWKPASS